MKRNQNVKYKLFSQYKLHRAQDAFISNDISHLALCLRVLGIQPDKYIIN